MLEKDIMLTMFIFYDRKYQVSNSQVEELKANPMLLRFQFIIFIKLLKNFSKVLTVCYTDEVILVTWSMDRHDHRTGR